MARAPALAALTAPPETRRRLAVGSCTGGAGAGTITAAAGGAAAAACRSTCLLASSIGRCSLGICWAPGGSGCCCACCCRRVAAEDTPSRCCRGACSGEASAACGEALEIAAACSRQDPVLELENLLCSSSSDPSLQSWQHDRVASAQCTPRTAQHCALQVRCT